MIAVEASVIMQLLVGDDPIQSRTALALFKSNLILISTAALIRTECTLRADYGFSDIEIQGAFEKLLGLPQVMLDSRGEVVRALVWYKHGMSFIDALQLAAARRSDGLATFDAAQKRSAKKIPGGPRILAI